MSAFLALAPDALNGTSLAKAELSYKLFVPSANMVRLVVSSSACTA